MSAGKWDKSKWEKRLDEFIQAKKDKDTGQHASAQREKGIVVIYHKGRYGVVAYASRWDAGKIMVIFDDREIANPPEAVFLCDCSIIIGRQKIIYQPPGIRPGGMVVKLPTGIKSGRLTRQLNE